MEQSSINNVQPEQKLNNEQMTIDTTSSPTIAKPIVGCSASYNTTLLRSLNKIREEQMNNPSIQGYMTTFKVS